MKKLLIFLGIFLVIILLIFSWTTSKYNGFVTLDEIVIEKWAQVENVYQRRADLIPNLVNTVKGAANFEKDTLTQVIEARSKATSVKIDPTNITSEQLGRFQKAQGSLGSALSRLLVTVERYPELKANQNFQNLQAQLEGTENRISVERKRFNEVVKGYNSTVRRFPNSLLAGIFGFFPKAYFQADAGAEQAPEVSF